MKNSIYRIAIFSMALAFLASCKTNTNMNNSSLIQKRRYTKGFHVNFKSKNHKVDQKKTSELTAQHIEGEQNPLAKPLSHKTYEMEVSASNQTELKNLKLDERTFSNLEDGSEDFAVSTPGNEKTYSAAKGTYGLNDYNPVYFPTGDQAIPAPAAEPESVLLLVLITILIPPLGVALVYGLSTEFWLSLVLTLLFYLPGLIYSLIVIFKD